MAERSVSVALSARVDSFLRSMDEAAAKTDTTARSIGDHFTAASSRVGGVLGGLGNQLESTFGIPTAGVFEKVGQKFEEAGAKGQGFMGTLSSMGGLAAGATAAGLGAVAVESIHLADKFEGAHAQLQNSLKNTGQSYDAVKGQIEAADSQGEKFGYTMTDTEGQLAKAETALGSTGKATTALTIAQNISAQTHKDLSASMMLAIKGMEGNTGALTRAGIQLPIVTGGAKALMSAQQGLSKAQDNLALVEEKIHDGRLKGPAASDALTAANKRLADAQQKVSDVQNAGNNVTQALLEKYRGAASASADTWQGKMKSVSAQVQDVGIKIGLVLIPILAKFMTIVGNVITWLEHHRTVALALAAVIAGPVVAAFAAWAVETLIAMAPFIAIGVAIAALVAAGYWLVENWSSIWDAIKDPVMTAWGIIQPIFDAVKNTISDVIQFVSDLVQGNWGALWGDFTNIVGDAFQLLFQWFIGLPARLLGLIADIATWLLPKGLDLIGGLLKGIATKVLDVYAFFYYTLPMTILQLLGSAAEWLLQKGWDVITGLFKGAQNAAWGMILWFAGIPGDILGAIGDLGTKLWQSGYDLISGMWGGIKAAWNWLADQTTFHVGGGSVFGISLPEATIHFLPHLAFGTPNFPGGLAMVGENGPELAALPQGTRVWSNSDTRQMLGGGGDDGGYVPIQIQVVLDHRVLIDVLHEGLLRKNRQSGSLRFS